MRFSEKILILMDRKGIKQQERLAKEIGRSQSTVSGWLNGAKPQKSAIIRLADFFAVDVECLLNDDQDLPSWEPAKKVQEQYSKEFADHLKDLREQSEEYQASENCFENKVLKRLDLIIEMLEKITPKG